MRWNTMPSRDEIEHSFYLLRQDVREKVQVMAATKLADKIESGEVDFRNRTQMQVAADQALLAAMEAVRAMDRFYPITRV